MTTELVKTLVSLFYNIPVEEVNLLHWKFVAGTLTVKLEAEDGMVEIATIRANFEGYARSTKQNDFDFFTIDDRL